ncbi:MAG: phosphotransferase, partial [Actinomycetota bacterium]|nr:phosphotransferase [Actinomycetota bacterium]
MRANVRGGTARDPLEEPVPVVDADLAAGVLRSAYGISGALRPLPGERDLNFDVRAASGERYVLKFVSPADPAEVVEMRVGAISHVRRVDPGLPVADLVPTADGGTGTRATGADGRVSQVQCYRFLPGHHAAREELGPDALAGLGRTAARLGRALRGYFHPAAAYSIPWDLRHAGELVGRLGLLAEPERSLAREALARFVSRAAPVVPSLRAQVVHNDLSRDNVLVDDSGSVVGILDFGDLTHTSLVFDLAIAIADVLDGRPGSVELAVPLVAGYSSLTPLEDDEAALLGDLVATRLAAAVVLGSWRRERHGAAPTYVDGAGRFLSLVAETGFDEFAAGLA